MSGGVFAYFRYSNFDISKKSEIDIAFYDSNDPTEEVQKEIENLKSSKSSNKTSGSSSSSSESSSESSDGSSSDSTPESESASAYVAFYGDSQSDTDGEDAIHQIVVNNILSSGANPIFHAGDLLEDGTVASKDRFNAVAATMLSTKSFYAAQGNNERNSSVYFDNFTFPGNEHYYSVNSGNLHMVILDNYATSVASGSAQYNWLLSDLQSEASQSRITGVIFHYPIYGVGGDTKGMLSAMVPLFISYGVDFVISGHEHVYQKTEVNGVDYFVASGQTSLGHFLMSVYSNSAVLRAYNNANTLIDTTTILER